MRKPVLSTLAVLCFAIFSYGQATINKGPEFSRQNVVVDDKVIDGNDYWAVVDPVFWSVSIYDGPRKYEEDLLQYSRPQRLLLSVVWHIAEVENGGHDQFYFNSTGIVWRDAIAGYRSMGLTKAANLLQESAKLLGGNPSLDRERRQAQLESRSPKFEKLDDRFYKLQEDPLFEKAILDYVRKNRSAFYFNGLVSKPAPAANEKPSN